MDQGKLIHDALTESVIGAFYDVYNILDEPKFHRQILTNDRKPFSIT
jgi:hypothetical protein